MILPLFLLSFLSAYSQSGIIYPDKPNQDTMRSEPVKFELIGPDAVSADSVIVTVPGNTPVTSKKGTLYPAQTGWMPVRYRLYRNNILVADKTDSVLIAGPTRINVIQIGALTQCYTNNNFCVTARPVDAFGNPVTFIWVSCGDGSEGYSDSNFTDTFCCRYTQPALYPRWIRVHDKYGGVTDTVFTNSLVKNTRGVYLNYKGGGYGPFDPDSDLQPFGDTQNVAEWHLFLDSMVIPKHSGIFDTLIDMHGCHSLTTYTLYKDGCEGFQTLKICLDSFPDSGDAWITYPYHSNTDTFGLGDISYELKGPATAAADSFVVEPFSKAPVRGKNYVFTVSDTGWLRVDYRLYKRSRLIAEGVDTILMIAPPVIRGYRIFTEDTQCYHNNSFCVAGSPLDIYGNAVKSVAVDCGDGRIISLDSPTDTGCCHYNNIGIYQQRIVASDKYGGTFDSLISYGMVTATEGVGFYYSGSGFGPLDPDKDLTIVGDTQDVAMWRLFIDNIEIPKHAGVFDTLIDLGGCHTLKVHTLYKNGCEAEDSNQVCLIGLGLGSFNPDIKMYPNPVSSVLYIESEKHMAKENLALVNVLGQDFRVTLSSPADSIYAIDVSDLPAGVYILYHTEAGIRMANRFVKY